MWTGISHGALIVLAGLVLVNPPADYKVAAAAVKPNVRRHDLDFDCSEMLRTPQFYFLFFAMLSVGIGGLMVTAQLKPVATNFKVGEAALTVALVLTPLANGSSRILWGWVSDYLGREWTMFTAFLLQAIFLVAATTLGRNGDVHVRGVDGAGVPHLGRALCVIPGRVRRFVRQQELGAQLQLPV